MTDDNIITIEWWYRDIHGRVLHTAGRHGVMEVDCRFFFPATKGNVNKLLAMNGREFDFSKPNIKKMLNCIEQRIKDLNGDIEAAKVTYRKLYSEWCDLHPQAESGKAPSGIRLTKEQWKDAKKRANELKVTMKKLENSVKNCQSKIRRLQENSEQIKGWETYE